MAALAAAMMERKDKADEKSFIVWLGVVQLFWGLVLNFEELSPLSSLNTIPSSTLLEKKGCKEPLGERTVHREVRSLIAKIDEMAQ